MILNDTGATANNATFVLTNFAGNSVKVAESADTVTSGYTVALGTLNKSVTSVDTSGVKGTQSFSLANTLSGAALKLSGSAAATVTATGSADTIDVSSTGGVTHSIDGGAGADVLNIAVKTGFVNAGSISNVETINMTVAAGNSIDLSGGATFTATARTINLLGGNSVSTFTTGTIDTAITTVNAAGFAGKLAATFGANTFDNSVTVTGGALTTDQVTASYNTAGTYAPKSSGVEVLALTASDANTTAVAVSVDLSGSTGVTRVNATVGNADTLTVENVTTQLIRVIDMQNNNGAVTLEAKLVDATGANDSVSFELKAAGAGNIDDGAILKTTDIETINLKVSSAESISLASLSMTDTAKFEKLVVTGDKALTVSALNANVTVIDASGMTTGGSFVQTGRSQTTAATYTGSVGDDTFIMRNSGDIIDAGAGTSDTLVINGNLVLGGLLIDLSSATDQLTTFNGSANAAVQAGFENVNLSGITGSFGADITAIKTGSTITGTANSDQIAGGAGADIINVTAGNDAVTGGGGNDTVFFTEALFINNSETTATHDGGTGTNTIQLEDAAINIVDADFVRLTNFQELKLTSGTNNVVIGTAAATTGIVTVTGGGGADTIVAAAGAQTITAGAGVDVLTGGAGADRIDGGEGNDNFIQTGVTDSGLLTAGATSTSTATLDVYNVQAGDTLLLAVDTVGTLDTLTTIAETGNLSNTVIAANVQQTRGIYNATLQTFTVASVAGGANAVLINYDDNVAGTAAAQSIVLVGVTALTSLADALITV